MSTLLFEAMERISPLTDEIKEAISTRMRPVRFKEHERFIHIGEPNHTCYFILKGLVRVYYMRNNREVSGMFLKEGQLIALAESFYFKRLSRHGVEALEDCEMLELRFDELEELYWQYPLFMNNSRLFSIYYNIYWRDRYELTTNVPVEEGYRSLLRTDPELIQRVPQVYLASYLHTTESHLSRIRSSIRTG